MEFVAVSVGRGEIFKLASFRPPKASVLTVLLTSISGLVFLPLIWLPPDSYRDYFVFLWSGRLLWVKVSGDSIIDITGPKSENKKSHSKPHAAKNNPCFLY